MSKTDTSRRSGTDWERLKAMEDSDIDLSENPEWTEEMFVRAILRKGLKPVPKKAQLTIRLDQDVLDWLRRRGRGYKTEINALLRAYMEAHK